MGKKVATIEVENLENKIKILDEDINKVKTIATLNALQGAKQQCVNLITELHNDDDQSNGSSDDS